MQSRLAKSLVSTLVKGFASAEAWASPRKRMRTGRDFRSTKGFLVSASLMEKGEVEEEEITTDSSVDVCADGSCVSFCFAESW